MVKFVSDIHINITPEAKDLLNCFENNISTLVENYTFIQESGVESILIVLSQMDNYADIVRGKAIFFEKQRLNLYPLNYPDNVSENRENYEKQRTKNLLFRSLLDQLIKEANLPELPNSNGFDLLLIYNKEEKDFPFRKSTSAKNAEVENLQSDKISFISLAPKYSIDQIILNDDLKQELQNVLAIIQHRKIIYQDWGFGEIDGIPRAIINFHGPSGTGKTMTAHAIASLLERRILTINYAEIESKYVGDAPKNLLAAFEAAQKENAVLFFDEADSFLGKRVTGVSSSSDQAINSLRSQMLILLENIDGVVVFATNLISNYDKAFESRILRHLKFDLPDLAARIKIIDKTIPLKVPFADTARISAAEITKLAEIADGFSGRHIKNAVLSALTQAAIKELPYLTHQDFVTAFEKYKISITEFSKDNGNLNLSPEVKKKLEGKIAEQLKANNGQDDITIKLAETLPRDS